MLLAECVYKVGGSIRLIYSRIFNKKKRKGFLKRFNIQLIWEGVGEIYGKVFIISVTKYLDDWMTTLFVN